MAYDIFKKYTGAGFGGGFQLYVNSKHKVKSQIDITANLFSINKILLIFENRAKTGPKNTVTTLTGGFVYQPVNKFEMAIGIGRSFHVDGGDLSTKAHAAYYLGNKKRVKVHAAFTHIFVKDKVYYTSATGIINAGLAIKLF